jgi:release factor glutamine methyltransferase
MTATPPTVLDILRRTTTYLAGAGVETPRIDAEWLLAHALACRRLDLYLRFDQPLAEGTLATLRSTVRRRARREPLQYVLGYTDFHQLRLTVGPGALVPRPETEELVERLLAMAVAAPPAWIADLGTGSGALALALAAALPAAGVIASDCNPEALAIARANAAALGLAGRVDLRAGYWCEPLDQPVDWIVANPPYLSEDEWAAAAPEVRDHEPKSALVAADNGLADLRQILTAAPRYLNPGGLLAMETGPGHHPALAALATELGYAPCWGEPDLARQPRFFFARRGA